MYHFNSRVRYSEINKSKHLDIGSALNYFQDCSTFHSEDIGRGLEYFEHHHKSWLLSSWQVIFHRLPKLGENIKINTWPYAFDHMFGYRNFLITDEQGEACAYANSAWFYYDTDVQRPTRIEQQTVAPYTLSEKYNMNYEPRKIMIPDVFVTVDSFVVKSCYIDTNNHVNNAQYIKMALDYLPIDYPLIQLRAEYRIAARLGDMIHVKTAVTENACFVLLCNEEDKPYTVIEFRKDL